MQDDLTEGPLQMEKKQRIEDSKLSLMQWNKACIPHTLMAVQ